MHMKKTTIRLDSAILQKLDLLDGSRSDNIRMAIEQYISHTNEVNAIPGAIPDLMKQNEILDEECSWLKKQNEQLRTLLEREQILHLQTQKALESPEKIKRRWWRIWKK